MPVLRESQIQRSVVELAKKQGFLAIKLTTLGRFGSSGWPDYMFLREGRVVFIEFKAPGKKTTPLQDSRHSALRRAGFKVYVVDNRQDGIDVLAQSRV